ncbi:MAG: hypothetical protein RMI88_07265 [Nitrososphaerota archaeon]|nr:hypothetical protein [Nitrososphaerota archaeon]
MNHSCAAFFDKDTKECKQTIEDHITSGIKFLEEMYIKRRYDGYITRLAHNLKINIPRAEVQRALYASYIFHDIGKLFKGYQEMKTNFSGHEIISSYWVYVHGEKMSLGSTLYPVIYAILLHHHDIRRSSVRKLTDIELCEECLKKLIKVYMDKTGVNIRDFIHKFEEEVSQQLLKVMGEIKRKMQKNTSIVIRLAYTFLQVIHSVDNYSSLYRSGKQTLLSKEVAKVYFSVWRLRENFSVE